MMRNCRGMSRLCQWQRNAVKAIATCRLDPWSLAQIHAALSHYHDHKGELDGQMQRQLENHRRLRNEAPAQLTQAALRARLGGG
ncbi:MAG: hypothetical protein NT154_01515 [Verrucomicrobia bacterium]|nr:hypothetical protein [Verrucomicrobiota bacterium]